MAEEKTINRSFMAMLASNQTDALISAGYSASDLRSAGYSASDLRSAGYSLSALISAGYSASDLRSAGYSASDLISAGYSLSALRSAGYSASDLRSAGYSLSDLDALDAEIPLIEKPYTQLWADIQAKNRAFDQGTFGPYEKAPEGNICGTAMCTAGHLVNMAGEAGYALKDKYGWKNAGAMIHYKAHPDWPCQNFGMIPDEWALAYIEEMAEREASEEPA